MVRTWCLVGVTAVLVAAACADRARTGAPTTTTSSPTPPGTATPASPAEVWTTTGGPASPGVPATGPIVGPNTEPGHDGGVR